MSVQRHPVNHYRRLQLAIRSRLLSEVHAVLQQIGSAGVSGIAPVYHESLLVEAIRTGNRAILQSLNDAGFRPSLSKSRTESGVLHTACEAAFSDLVKLFVEMGAPVDAPDECGRTPLHHAVMASSLASVHVLLAAGANPNALDNEGYTPLNRVEWHSVEVLAPTLLAAGADPHLPNDRNVTP